MLSSYRHHPHDNVHAYASIAILVQHFFRAHNLPHRSIPVVAMDVDSVARQLKVARAELQRLYAEIEAVPVGDDQDDLLTHYLETVELIKRLQSSGDPCPSDSSSVEDDVPSTAMSSSDRAAPAPKRGQWFEGKQGGRARYRVRGGKRVRKPSKVDAVPKVQVPKVVSGPKVVSVPMVQVPKVVAVPMVQPKVEVGVDTVPKDTVPKVAVAAPKVHFLDAAPKSVPWKPPWHADVVRRLRTLATTAKSSGTQVKTEPSRF